MVLLQARTIRTIPIDLARKLVLSMPIIVIGIPFIIGSCVRLKIMFTGRFRADSPQQGEHCEKNYSWFCRRSSPRPGFIFGSRHGVPGSTWCCDPHVLGHHDRPVSSASQGLLGANCRFARTSRSPRGQEGPRLPLRPFARPQSTTTASSGGRFALADYRRSASSGGGERSNGSPLAPSSKSSL